MKTEIYSEESFCKLAEKLQLENVDLKSFPDLTAHPEPAGRPTAVSYIHLKQLILILGEEKAGKTWMALYLACKMAYNPKEPKSVVYFYGEGDTDELEKRFEIIKHAWCKESGATEGSVLMVNLNDRDWGDEGFDLKRKDHQDYFRARLEDEKKKTSYKLEGIILDNYASLMGKNQEGNAAIKLLQFLRQYQRKELAVLLACHTNRKFEVGGSIHLPRRTNGIILLTRNALWKKKIEQKLDSTFSQNVRGKKNPSEALRNTCDDIKRENNEEEAQYNEIHLHVSFSTFRNALPAPEEHTIDLNNQTLKSVVVTTGVKNRYTDEYCERLIKRLPSTKGPTVPKGHVDKDELKDEALEDLVLDRKDMAPAPLSHTFEETMSMTSVEDQVKALKQIVEEAQCKNRHELADALNVKEDDLKNLMKGRIHNKDINLQARAGRPKK